MMSEDKASFCEPRNRNGRMLVASTLDNDGDCDAGVVNDDDVFSEA